MHAEKNVNIGRSLFRFSSSYLVHRNQSPNARLGIIQSSQQFQRKVLIISPIAPKYLPKKFAIYHLVTTIFHFVTIIYHLETPIIHLPTTIYCLALTIFHLLLNFMLSQQPFMISYYLFMIMYKPFIIMY